MASNAELKASIVALDESATVEGLNNAQLSALLKELKGAAEAEAEAETLRVVAGKSITSKRGILGPNEPVHESDVHDLDALKKRGFVA